jgi:flagellar protein FliL
MSDPDQNGADSGKSGGKKGLLIGFLAAVLLGGGGFYAAYSGLVGGRQADTQHESNSHDETATAHAGIDFVPLESLVVSLGRGATNRHLKFTAQLEVASEFKDEVMMLQPRVLDVLNGYLRAVEARDIESPSSLGRLRAQMLRRVQVVAGEGRVRDLLITEFVLN